MQLLRGAHPACTLPAWAGRTRVLFYSRELQFVDSDARLGNGVPEQRKQVSYRLAAGRPELPFLMTRRSGYIFRNQLQTGQKGTRPLRPRPMSARGP